MLLNLVYHRLNFHSIKNQFQYLQANGQTVLMGDCNHCNPIYSQKPKQYDLCFLNHLPKYGHAMSERLLCL